MARETDPELTLLFDAFHSAHPRRLSSVSCKFLTASPEYAGPFQEEWLLRPGQLKQAMDALLENRRPTPAKRIDPWKLCDGENDSDEEGRQKQEASQGERDEERTPSEHSACERFLGAVCIIGEEKGSGGEDSRDREDGINEGDDSHSEVGIMKSEPSEAETTNSVTVSSHPQEWKRGVYSRQRYEMAHTTQPQFPTTLTGALSAIQHK